MNRADRMLEVLRDGRPHSREDVFSRVGYLMTNNAAAELRLRGLDVQHYKHDGLDIYELVGTLDATDSPLSGGPAAVESVASSAPDVAAAAADGALEIHENQLTLGVAA